MNPDNIRYDSIHDNYHFGKVVGSYQFGKIYQGFNKKTSNF